MKILLCSKENRCFTCGWLTTVSCALWSTGERLCTLCGVREICHDKSVASGRLKFTLCNEHRAKKSTSSSRARHGGAKGHRTTQGDQGTIGEAPPNISLHLLQPVFSGQKGVRRLLGGMLHPTNRSGPRFPSPFPAQSIGWHHESSFLATSTARAARNFSTKKSRKRTDTHRERTLLSAPTSEPSPN